MSDKLSKLPTDLPGKAHADDSPTIKTRLSLLCYTLVCLHVLLFGYIAVAHPSIYLRLTREDGLVENLTAVAFLLGGIALLGAALANRRLFPRCAYVLGGLALIFFGGEEISWGQRIIGFETPRFLADANVQGDFELHNRHNIKGIFSYQNEALLALCIAGCAAFFCRKDRIFGILSPPILLTLALLITMSYGYKGNFSNFPSSFPQQILLWHRELLLLLLIFALFSRNAGLFIATAASLTLTLVFTYLSYQNRDLRYWEDWEYTFAALCLFYAMEALLDQRTARRKIAALRTSAFNKIPLPRTYMGRVFRNQKARVGYHGLAVVCALVIAGSVGLAFRVYFDDRIDAAAFNETYSLTQSIEPAARSDFDVYVDGRFLHYFKQSCGKNDTSARFFLGVFPVDIADLRAGRQRYGFENLDFSFDIYGHRLNGACAARVRLPGWDIARIETGQSIWEQGESRFTHLWSVNLHISVSEP